MKRFAILAIVLAVSSAEAVRAQDAGDNGGRLPGAQSEQKLKGTGGYACSARNALGTRQCTTTCSSQDTADCEDADGSAEPVCRCTGS